MIQWNSVCPPCLPSGRHWNCRRTHRPPGCRWWPPVVVTNTITTIGQNGCRTKQILAFCCENIASLFGFLLHVRLRYSSGLHLLVDCHWGRGFIPREMVAPLFDFLLLVHVDRGLLSLLDTSDRVYSWTLSEGRHINTDLTKGSSTSQITWISHRHGCRRGPASTTPGKTNLGTCYNYFISNIRSIYLYIYIYIYLRTYLSIYLPLYLSTYLSINLSIYLPTYLPIYFMSVYIYLYIYLSTYLTICLSIKRYIYLSTYQSIYRSTCLVYLYI